MAELVSREGGCDKIVTYNPKIGKWEVYDAWEYDNLPNARSEFTSPSYFDAWAWAVVEEDF